MSVPLLLQHEIDAAVGLPLVLGLREDEAADLAQRRDVAAAVGLRVEADDLDQPLLREVVAEGRLELEQLGLGPGPSGGDEGDAHGEVLGHDGVGAAETLLQRSEEHTSELQSPFLISYA